MTDTDPLLLTRDGAVATLTINRPERLNALSYAMFTQLPKLMAEAAAMPGIRALVLRGAGTRAFSAGADISEFETTRMTREQAAAYDDAILAAEEAVAAFPSPTLAAVHGHCYGGGCALAVACDMRFAAAGARFAITPAKLGLVYPLRGTKRLVNLVGPSRAKIILMSGADYSAAKAQAFGLVDEVYRRPGRARRRGPRVHRPPRRPLRHHPARRQGDRRPHRGRHHPRRRVPRTAPRLGPGQPRLRGGRPRLP